MELRVFLKVCEACGCLWYRAQLETTVYCDLCRHRFKDFPTPQSRKRPGRKRKTVLPAVFAVATPYEETECFERARLQPRHERDQIGGTLAPEGIPIYALMPSATATLSAGAR